MLVYTLITMRSLPATSTYTRVTIHLVTTCGTIDARVTAALINVWSDINKYCSSHAIPICMVIYIKQLNI